MSVRCRELPLGAYLLRPRLICIAYYGHPAEPRQQLWTRKESDRLIVLSIRHFGLTMVIQKSQFAGIDSRHPAREPSARSAMAGLFPSRPSMKLRRKLGRNRETLMFPGKLLRNRPAEGERGGGRGGCRPSFDSLVNFDLTADSTAGICNWAGAVRPARRLLRQPEVCCGVHVPACPSAGDRRGGTGCERAATRFTGASSYNSSAVLITGNQPVTLWLLLAPCADCGQITTQAGGWIRGFRRSFRRHLRVQPEQGKRHGR